MKTIGKLVLCLSMQGLAGGAFAEGAGEQTTPGASHGPTTVNPSGPGRSGSDASAAAGMGQVAHGSSSNGTSAAAWARRKAPAACSRVWTKTATAAVRSSAR